MKKNNFKFYVEDLQCDIVKGTDKSGKTEEKMKVYGVASTMDQDHDGEILDPNGFDLSHFTQTGFVNWHHQTKNDPSSIIGEPTKAVIKDGKLHIEAELYPWSELAKKVYTTAKNLAANKTGRKLGWSIEGKVLEKDPLNEKFIKKAAITGVAITPMPKNAKTWMDICKGHVDFIEEGFDIIKGQDANGGPAEYLLDFTDENGTRTTIDKDFKITINKSLSTTSGAALRKESLEGAIHTPQGQKYLEVPHKACAEGIVDSETTNKLKSKFKELLGNS